MALQPDSYERQEILQPGARGEIFNANQPGYRGQEDRINRTNNHMNISAHDTPNVKYEFDYRLPVLFRYGWAFGFNQIVVPKGRIVACDPYMDLVDFETQKLFNTLTLANGGAPVRLRETTDTYPTFTGQDTDLVSKNSQGAPIGNVGKDWIYLNTAAYTAVATRPFASKKTASEQLAAAGFSYSPETGRIVEGTAGTGAEVINVRPGNIPLGMIERNEYTRDQDAYNGIMPGPVLTDAIVEFAWFAFKDKAEENLWGSAYGQLFIGALVKPDENGRITISPLSYPDLIKTMDPFEIEMERQQVIGQVYAVNHEIVPEGAAKWATWALEDRLAYEGFNPALYAKNNRRGEDAVASTAYMSTGKYPGYPYDKNYMNHDLHMLASTGRQDAYDPRMNDEYRYSDMGIPGLTDGYNAVKKTIEAQKVGLIHYAGGKEYEPMFFKTIDVDIVTGSLQICIGKVPTADSDYEPLTKGAFLKNNTFKARYASELQGLFVLEVADKAAADTLLEDSPAEVYVKYEKRGEAGIPTFMDWDGICGSVKILLTK